jgi:hypothetical protein
MILVVPVQGVNFSAARLHSSLPTITPNLSIHDVNEGVQFAIGFGQAPSNFGQITFGSAHIAPQSHTGSCELSHNSIILSQNSTVLSQPSLQAIQAFFGLGKALVGLGEPGVKSRVHARLILE